MKRLISYNVFEGDPNFIREGQILVIRDNSTTDKVLDIQQRINGKLVSILSVPEVTFTITPTPADATVTINGKAGASAKVPKGSTVVWSVAKTGYQTQSGNDVVCADTTKAVTLVTNPGS